MAEMTQCCSWPERKLEDAISYAMLNGLVVRSGDGEEVTHIPFSLYPSTEFSPSAFESVTKIQKLFNEVVFRNSEDFPFLEKVLEQTSFGDPFTSQLLKIGKKSYQRERKEKGYLGLWRSDYMVQESTSTDDLIIRQIEFNTISVSYAALSQKLSAMHRFFYDSSTTSLPQNNSCDSFINTIKKAWELFGDKDAIVLFVVQPNEKNIFDQKVLEFGLREKGICVVRASLLEIDQFGEMDQKTNNLLFKSRIVGVAYLRAGYTPTDYPTEREWGGREKIEMASCISAPDCATQLVGSKKIQQLWCEEGVLEQYLSKEECSSLRLFFAELYSLNEGEYEKREEFERVLERVRRNPRGWVLKPQREGGGHNYYAEEMVKKLEVMSREEMGAHIIMERIWPQSFQSCHVQKGKAVEKESVAELGVYGVYLRERGGKRGEEGEKKREEGERGGGEKKGEEEKREEKEREREEVRVNEAAGYLLRTKSVESDEGGVSSGYAVLDSLDLGCCC